MVNEIKEENNLTNQTENIIPVANKVAKHPSFTILIILLIIVGFLLILVSVFTFNIYRQNLKFQEAQSNQIKESLTPTQEVKKISPSTNNIQSNIVWFSSPKKINFLPIFKDNGNNAFSVNEENGAEFYEVADLPEGDKLIDGRIHFEGPGDFTLVRFIKSGDNYSLVTSGLDEYSKEEILRQILPSVIISDVQFSELKSPETLVSTKLNLSKLYETSKFINEIENVSKIFDSQYGPVYKNVDLEISGISGVSLKKYYLKLKDNSIIEYQLSPNKDSNFFRNITWSSGNKNTTDFNQNIVLKCSLGGVGSPFVSQNSILIANKQEIGKTFLNEPVYQVTDPNNLLVKEFYKIYKTGREFDSSNKIISLEEYSKQRNHFLWQDQDGDWQIFISGDYSPLAECGKPVIYLYPQKNMEVNVQVGAKISKSEPLYPPKGWTVLAKPNGELIYQGKTYQNLFWEGLGKGSYPNYKKYGVVVEQKNLITVLKNQLKQLGLNSQESADFMDFWQPKLPQTPYVRLTWLNTKDMDELAPVSVFPKPDTKIRIFLEFEGLNKPEKLISQKLSSIPRNGFTLIEWGGLLLK